MKHFMRLSLLLIILIALFSSCKKAAPKQTKHIPKNAVFVAGINTKSLYSKLEKNQATLENIFRSFSDNDSSIDKGKQDWEDFKSSGLDLQDNFYVSVINKGGGMGLSSASAVIAGIGSVKDASKLEAYIKKKHPGNEIRKEKDYTSISFAGQNMVAWNNELVIAMSYQETYAGGMEFDSITGSYNLKRPANTSASLKAEMDSYFNLKEDASVAYVPEFRDLMQENGDASLWVNSSSSMENIPLPLPKLKELLGNSFTAAILNFEDGKIEVKSKSYYSKELRDILKEYTGPTVDLDLISNYPSNNINAFMAFSFNPETINGIVKYLEVGGMVDGFLTKMMGTNYTLQEALKAIKGDFALVVSDVVFNQNITPGNTGKGMATNGTGKVLFNAPIRDKVQMNRLMDKLVQTGMLVKVNNEYQLTPQIKQMGLKLSVDDKNLLVATDSLVLSQYKLKAQKANIEGSVLNDFKKKSAVFYVNIESILNRVSANPDDTMMNTILPKAKQTFRDIKAYTENFNGKNMEGHYEFRFKNEKENSLTSLLQFINTVATTAKAHKRIPRTDVDSVVVPNPGTAL